MNYETKQMTSKVHDIIYRVKSKIIYINEMNKTIKRKGFLTESNKNTMC